MNEDDQALSRLAAKAIGLEIGAFQALLSSMPDDYVDGGFMVGEVHPAFGFRGYYWNPLEHAGDAFRLMVALRLDIVFDGQSCVRVNYVDAQGCLCAVESHVIATPYADIRRAIVLAAAEIEMGKSLTC